jgi:hypothetical protein
VRRSIVIVLAVMAAAASGLALGASAGGASSAAAHPIAHIICPLGAGRTMTVPCCGPPISGAQAVYPCCAGAAMIACPVPAATISASPEPSLSGAVVTISGVVTGAGTAVQLWQELPGRASFSVVASTTADSAGAYRFTLPAGSVTTNRSWYVTAGRVHSATLSHQVKAKLSFTASPRRTPAGRRMTLSGTVAPSHAGERVLLQRQAGTGWKLVARVPLSAASRFRTRIRFTRAGRVRLRVLLPADARNVQSQTGVITLTVTSSP